MTRASSILIGLLLLGVGTPARSACPAVMDDCHFTVLTAAFDSPDSSRLGYNVAFALQHQIFRTFVLSIPVEGGDDICCFPRDTLALLVGGLTNQSRAEAVDRGRLEDAQLVLWGKAWPWRERVVVQPYLSVIGPPQIEPRVEVCCTNTERFSRQRPFTPQGDWRIWQITANDARGEPRTLSIRRFPRDLYDLPQISLDTTAVDRFRSLAGLPVYRERNVNSRIPGVETGSSIAALQHVGAWTKIANPSGWIKLPRVDAGPIVDFIGGLVNFLRGNWERAATRLGQVARDETAPSAVRVDAALFLAASQYHLDSSCPGCEEPIAIAKRINPYSPITARFELMMKLARVQATGGGEGYLELREEVEREKALFPPQDEFTESARQFLESLTE